MADEEVKWSWTKFWIGKLSNKFIAFLVFTIIMFITMYSVRIHVDEKVEWIVWIVYGVVTIIFMLAGAIDKAVENAKINLEIKAGASISKEIKEGAAIPVTTGGK